MRELICRDTTVSPVVHMHTQLRNTGDRVRRGEPPQGKTVPKKPSPSHLTLGKVGAVNGEITRDQQK